MRVAIGSDHAGYRMKEFLIKYMEEKGIEVEDVGAYSEERVDYPVYAEKVCELVKDNKVNFGVLICGTGLGMMIAANRFKGIRATLCLYPEMARFARKHNDANVLVLAGRLMGEELAKWTFEAFISTEFEGGRHEKRVKMLEELG